MVVLATKLYVDGAARDRALRSLRGLIADRLGELAVEFDVQVRADGFPVVSLSGSDATAAESILAEEFDTIPETLTPGETYTGTLTAWDTDGITVDAGQPVVIPTAQLGLGPGQPEQIRTRFGLVQHLPLTFEYGDVPQLADGERDRLYEWRRGPGRVNVNSATRSEVRATVNRAGHATDIITVERLGVLEQSILCQPDTDPPGLIASIGEYLPAELLAVVS